MDGIHAGVHIGHAVPAALAESSHFVGLIVQLFRESYQNLHIPQQITWLQNNMRTYYYKKINSHAVKSFDKKTKDLPHAHITEGEGETL